MDLVNLTPHAITIVALTATDGAPIVIAPNGTVARCATSSVEVDRGLGALGITTVRTVYGDVVGLPAPAPGVVLIVSGLVLDHPSTAHRTDLAAPGELVRGPDGQPIGCRGLRVR